MTALDTPRLTDVSFATATAISDAGWITGYFHHTNGLETAFVFDPEVGLIDVGGIPGASTRGVGVNDRGWMAGSAKRPDGSDHAVIWERNKPRDLGFGYGYGINNYGTVCGSSNGWPVIYRGGEVIPVLARVLGEYWPSDINDREVMAGVYMYYQAPYGWKLRGFVAAEAEGVMDLNDLIPRNSGWRVDFAHAINNHGQIVGQGLFIGQSWAIRLDPIPPLLTIERSGTNALVSWSPAWPGIVLEATDRLAEPLWQSVATGGTNMVAVPAGGRARFCRLNLEGIRGLCCPPR